MKIMSMSKEEDRRNSTGAEIDNYHRCSISFTHSCYAMLKYLRKSQYMTPMGIPLLSILLAMLIITVTLEEQRPYVLPTCLFE